MSDGGEQDVFSGGTAINIFGNDSEQNVFFGGLAVNATFTSDSTQDVFGVASNTTLSASTQEVESGGPAIGTLVLLGDDFGFPTSGQQFVQGVAISTTLGNSGTLELDFGTAINTVVGSGGGLFGNGTLAGSLLDNGVVSFEAVGNTSFTLSGSGTFEIDGGEAVVNAAGFTGSVTVSFATLQLVGGALAGSRPIAIGQDGTLELTGPGVAGSRPISLVDTGAVVRIDGTSMPTNTISGFSAGDVIDLADVAFVAGASATLNGSNNLAIVAGGSTYHLQFNSSVAGNAFELLPDGNSGISATLAQAVSFVASGVTSSGNSVASGAYQNVYGTANSVTVNAGGFQEVFSGGVTTGTTVSGSASFPAVVGDQQIFAGGTASGTIIEDNGQQDVRGTAVSTVLSGFDAVQNVYSGAVLINTVLIHGTQNVLSGAVVSGEILSGNIFGGPFQQIAAGGTAISMTLEGQDVFQEVFGVQIGAVNSGFINVTVESGGTDIGATIGSGTNVTVQGGTSISATIESGGTEFVENSFNGPAGTVIGATVSSGGALVLDNGSIASGVAVAAFGTLVLENGASASGVSLAPGAILEFEGANLSGYTVANGSTVEFLNGNAINTTAGIGALAFFDGGAVVGGTISGGTFALFDDAAAGGAFTFAGGGTLEVGFPQHLNLNILSAAVISGFAAGDTIEIAGNGASTTGPANGVTLLPGNVLQVVAAGFVFDLYLDPNQNFTGQSFLLTSGGPSNRNFFVTLSQTIISRGTAFISAGRPATALKSSAAGPLSSFPVGRPEARRSAAASRSFPRAASTAARRSSAANRMFAAPPAGLLFLADLRSSKAAALRATARSRAAARWPSSPAVLPLPPP
jgi:autotransporter passenger strand-loop-strand repeat protein